MSFCLCMSARKSLIFVICVQNIWKSHFSNKEIKHWLFGLVYSLGVLFCFGGFFFFFGGGGQNS